MAYTTVAEVKTFCHVSGNTDDTLLTAILASAEAVVENYTGTVFDNDTAANQTFTRLPGVRTRFDGNKLYFYDWLATDTSVTITDSPTVMYLPEDGPPYYGCMLTEGSWAYPTVTVNGKWGYSTAPPADIEMAVWRICRWLYDMQTTGRGSAPIVTPNGQVLIPEGLPLDIKQLLDPYRKVRIV
jgi:hypothetical protein